MTIKNKFLSISQFYVVEYNLYFKSIFIQRLENRKSIAIPMTNLFFLCHSDWYVIWCYTTQFVFIPLAYCRQKLSDKRDIQCSAGLQSRRLNTLFSGTGLAFCHLLYSVFTAIHSNNLYNNPFAHASNGQTYCGGNGQPYCHTSIESTLPQRNAERLNVLLNSQHVAK